MNLNLTSHYKYSKWKLPNLDAFWWNISSSINHSFLKSARLLWKWMCPNFFSTFFFSARNISMAEEKLLLLVITYARPRLFFSTLKVHDLMVTNCYYTFFSTYNLVTTSVYFASTCSLSKTCFASLKFSWLFANFLLMKNRSKFHICPAWICRFFMDSVL